MARVGRSTRVPMGNDSSRKPSPAWTTSGGVRSSTSSTRPGRRMSSMLSSPRDRDKCDAGCADAGVQRVIDRLAPVTERVDGANQLRQLARDARPQLQRGRKSGGGGIHTDKFQLTKPEWCQVHPGGR